MQLKKLVVATAVAMMTSGGAVAEKSAPGIEIQSVVMLGQRLEEYKRLIEEHSVDLLVMNTKDEYQAAMHGLAYPLAVERERGRRPIGHDHEHDQ